MRGVTSGRLSHIHHNLVSVADPAELVQLNALQ